MSRALATAKSLHATENFTPQPLWTMPSEPNPRTSPTKSLISFVVSASALKSTDFPPGCLGCWLQSATLRNRWRTLAVHPPAAAYARLTGHGCICVHWTLKLCRKTTDATRGLICRRWRRRIVSSCREHRLNLLHPWKKQRACRDSPREAGCDCTSCAPTRVRRCLLDQAHSAVTRLRLPPEAAGFDSPVGQPRGLRLLRLKQGARLPSALEFAADRLSRPLLMAPPLTLAGTFPGAAAPCDRSGTSRTVSAAAADAVAAAAALAPDRRDLSSMVRRSHTCARAGC